MRLEFREMDVKDYKKAVQSAIKGMHFDWYLDSGLLLNLYGKYFWYMEMLRATQMIAVYADDKFAGVLLAEMKGEPRKYRSFWKALYVRIFDVLQHIAAGGSVGLYEETSKEMLSQYSKNNSPDGEIIFLAAVPEMKMKGIGSILLREFERREKGKQVYLYTDNACTYQFYEHRGFERAGEKDIVLELGNKKVELKCLLYSKNV